MGSPCPLARCRIRCPLRTPLSPRVGRSPVAAVPACGAVAVTMAVRGAVERRAWSEASRVAVAAVAVVGLVDAVGRPVAFVAAFQNRPPCRRRLCLCAFVSPLRPVRRSRVFQRLAPRLSETR